MSLYKRNRGCRKLNCIATVRPVSSTARSEFKLRTVGYVLKLLSHNPDQPNGSQNIPCTLII